MATIMPVASSTVLTSSVPKKTSPAIINELKQAFDRSQGSVPEAPLSELELQDILFADLFALLDLPM